jgi:hypothetical protein
MAWCLISYAQGQFIIIIIIIIIITYLFQTFKYG